MLVGTELPERVGVFRTRAAQDSSSHFRASYGALEMRRVQTECLVSVFINLNVDESTWLVLPLDRAGPDGRGACTIRKWPGRFPPGRPCRLVERDGQRCPRG